MADKWLEELAKKIKSEGRDYVDVRELKQAEDVVFTDDEIRVGRKTCMALVELGLDLHTPHP